MSERTLDQWLVWFEHVHPLEMDLRLDRVEEVSKNLCIRELPCPVITVGGTNGKGSTVSYLETIYRRAGYKTGATISPHILRFNERIRVNGEDVDDARLCRWFSEVEAKRGEVALTFFEFAILGAVYGFVESGVDVIILEVGLGGRLDAANLWDADVSIVTNVSLDHEQWLGKGRDAIGREKAGIARAGRPCVVGDLDPPYGLTTQLQAIGCDLIQNGVDYQVRDLGEQFAIDGYGEFPRPGMIGHWQLSNAACAVIASTALSGRLPVSKTQQDAGIAGTVVTGRMQVREVAGRQVMFDVGHNPAAAQMGVDAIKALAPKGRVRAVSAIMSDKAYQEVAALWCQAVDAWYVGNLQMPRALKSSVYAEVLNALNAKVTDHPQLVDAFDQAIADSEADDLVVVFGSFYTVEAVMRHLQQR